MPDLTRQQPEAAPPGQLGYVTKAPAAPGEPFTVTVPGFSEQHFYEITRWMPRGDLLPEVDDEVLVVKDDNEQPWAIAWFPKNPPSEPEGIVII